MMRILPLLLIAACSQDDGITSVTSEQAPPPGVPLSLDVSQLSAGTTATLSVADADPGEQVYLLRSTNGMGNGPCPPTLGGMCVDLTPGMAIMGPVTASVAGTAVLTPTLPAAVPFGTNVCLQAVAIRGPGGADSVKSPVVCRTTNNGPVSLIDGANTGDTYNNGTSMGGPNLSYAMKYTSPTQQVVGYAEVFTGEQAGMNTLELWSHDSANNQPLAMVATTSWDMTNQNEWQGGDFGQRIVMPQGSVWWVVWQPINGAQASKDSSGTPVDYRGSFTGGAPWNGPFTNFEKFKLCGGGGCP